MKRSIPQVLFWLCLVAGAWQLGTGGYLQAKAWFAQWLLERAWAETLQTGETSPPWPWADTYPVARMQVPRLGLQRLLLAGDSGRTLAFGPGVREGDGSLQLISGHRDTHFRFLAELAVGDRLKLQGRDGAWRSYRVRETAVVEPGPQGLRLPADLKGLVLITCYPFDALQPGGRQRFLVWAAPTPAGAGSLANPV